MEKLSRITIGSIDNLVNGNCVENIGDGVIKANRWIVKSLKIQTPQSREVLTSRDTTNVPRDVFLSYADEMLTQRGMYLADVEYRAEKGSGFFPHRLRGRFYKEKTE